MNQTNICVTSAVRPTHVFGTVDLIKKTVFPPYS